MRRLLSVCHRHPGPGHQQAPEGPDGACKAPSGRQRMQNGLWGTQGSFIDTWNESTLSSEFLMYAALVS